MPRVAGRTRLTARCTNINGRLILRQNTHRGYVEGSIQIREPSEYGLWGEGGVLSRAVKAEIGEEYT